MKIEFVIIYCLFEQKKLNVNPRSPFLRSITVEKKVIVQELNCLKNFKDDTVRQQIENNLRHGLSVIWFKLGLAGPVIENNLFIF